MFSEIWSKKKCSIFESSCKSGSDDDQGLRILTKIPLENSNVVVKPIFLLTSKPSISQNHHSNDCYLKSCHLCLKPLNLDKEVYMYRGDLGFCSVECRERQIYLDDTKEMEASTKRILSTFRQRGRDSGGRCETTKLLEEFRRRRHQEKEFLFFLISLLISNFNFFLEFRKVPI